MADELNQEVIVENFTDIKLGPLALNTEKFGEITFDRSLPNLESMQSTFKEFTDLQYDQKLIPEFVNQINSQRDRFVEFLRRLQTFRLSEGFNKDIRDGFENEVEALYQEVYRSDLPWLTFLRQDASIQSKDTKKLQDEQKAVAKLKSEYEQIIKQLEEKKSEYEKETTAVQKAAGEKAAVTFGKHFEQQAGEYRKEAQKWENGRMTLYWIFLVIVIINVLLYAYFFTTFKLNIKPHLDPNDFFTLQYGIFKVALLGLISWAMGYSAKNYYINSRLESSNLHRKNVAETIRDFSKSNPSESERGEVMRIGADAMFSHAPTNSAYSSKEVEKENGPVDTIITNVIKGKV